MKLYMLLAFICSAGWLSLSAQDLSTNIEKKEESKFVVIEKMPVFPGGDAALMKFLQQNLQYPETAREMGIEGRVYVSFSIDTDGSVTDIKIAKGIGGKCDEEALRVIRMMPRWEPGEQEGKAVKVNYNLPIRFALE